MPFTGSHPAAVLALTRTGLPASALVIGSLAPDLPYFVPVRIGGFYPPWSLGIPTHTAWAVPTLDVALGFAAWIAWHGVLAAPAAAAAPAAVRQRLDGRVDVGPAHRLRDPRHLLAVAVALGVGAATHVVWDEFTHAGRWGTRHLAVLRDVRGGLEGYRWAQYTSGLVGAVVILTWLWNRWRSTADSPVARPGTPQALPAPAMAAAARAAWGLIIGAAAVAGVAAALVADGARAAAFAGATRGGAAGAMAATALALGRHVHRR